MYELRTRVDGLGGVLEHGSFLLAEAASEAEVDGALATATQEGVYALRLSDGAVRCYGTPWVGQDGQEV